MQQLVQEYLHTAQCLKEHIAFLQAQKEILQGEAYFTLQRRIELLQDEYYHTRSIARHLQRTYLEGVAGC